MRRSGAVSALVAVIVGCSSPAPSDATTVVVDDTFTGDEMSYIHEGLSLWESATPVRYTWETMPHDALLEASKGASRTHVIYLTQCPMGTLDSHTLALTKRVSTGSRISLICLGAYRLTPASWPVTVAHEVGHAMGLEHDTSGRPAIMAPTLETASTRVEESDIEALMHTGEHNGQ